MFEILQTPILVWLGVAVLLFLSIRVAFYFGKQASRKDALRRQRPILAGKISEQLALYLKGFPEDLRASEARFLGTPIDFLIFKGMDDQNIEEVVFVEVKSGVSSLNKREKSLRDAIEAKRVRWYEYRVDSNIF